MSLNDKDLEALDPVVARTRTVREALAQQCDYDLDKMVELFRSMQAQHPQRVRPPQRSRAADDVPTRGGR